MVYVRANHSFHYQDRRRRERRRKEKKEMKKEEEEEKIPFSKFPPLLNRTKLGGK